MSKDKRKKRKQIDQSEIDLLLPVDITKLGSQDDPCFGKHHDLSAPECKECGDSDFCALAKAQNLNQVRLNIEANQRFKDIEEAGDELVKKKEKAVELVKEYKNQGIKRLKTILRISRELNLTKDEVKQIYDQN